MISRVYIKNFALIRELTFAPSAGLNLLTGETGAGKSILVSAFNLLLGKRAESGLAGNPDEKVLTEAEIKVDARYKGLFESLDLVYEPTTLVRREIWPNGRSRAFVNDSPVTLEVLSQLMDHLLDVHSQNQNLLLRDQDFRLALLDQFAGNDALLAAYSGALDQLKAAQDEQRAYERNLQQQAGDPDYLRFLVDELDAAGWKEGEQAQLEEELKTLESHDEILQRLGEILQLFEGHEASLDGGLSSVRQSLSALSKLGGTYEEWAQRWQSLQDEARDVAREVARKLDGLDNDPARKQAVEERLDLVYRLQQKHHVLTEGELLAKWETLASALEDFDASESTRAALAEGVRVAKGAVAEAAGRLAKKRQEVIPALEAELKTALNRLNLQKAHLSLELETVEEYGPRGNQVVQFQFSANPGHAPKPVEKAASGGELARIMVAIKAALARSKALPTIFFDEIDTGVSGQTAHLLGDLLADMASHMQVVVITHLPQVAARKGQHLRVVKTVDQGRSETRLELLGADERIGEIGRLLDGDQPGDAALENARHLLLQAAGERLSRT